jgi:glycerophosphoryl diester phosphodiesterase
MEAFARALTDGAATVECDLRLTADRQWVVHHDAELMLAREKLRIADLDLSDLRKVAHASGDQAVPTLSEFLAWTQSSGINPVLDVKDTRGMEELVATVDQAELSSPPVVSSFRKSVLDAIKSARPHWETALIVGNPRFRIIRQLTFNSFFNWARHHRCAALHLHERWVTPAIIARIHSAGMRVAIWTVDDPLRMTLLRSLGVDAIITNRPDLGRTACGARVDDAESL